MGNRYWPEDAPGGGLNPADRLMHKPQVTVEDVQDVRLQGIESALTHLTADVKPLRDIPGKLELIQQSLNHGSDRFDRMESTLADKESRVHQLELEKERNQSKIERCDRLEKEVDELKTEVAQNSHLRKMMWGAMTVGGGGLGVGVMQLLNLTPGG